MSPTGTPERGRGTIIRLGDAEYAAMVAVGTAWHENAERQGFRDKLGRTDLDKDIVGAGGEIAVARLLGIPYDIRAARTAFNDRPDVGTLNVRTTRRPGGDLIVRPKTNDTSRDGPFALVECTDESRREFRIVGWMHSDEIRQPRYWRPERGEPVAWWVPQSALHPFTLIEVEYEQQRWREGQPER